MARRSWAAISNTAIGDSMSGLFMHSINRLPVSMMNRIDAASAQVDQLMSRYADPVMAYAQQAGYDPQVDSAWRLKMFVENDLTDILKGRVNYQKYMGERYSPDMVELVKKWAEARIEMPEVVGFSKRARYDERRRSYFDSERPLFGPSGQSQGRGPEYKGNFLHARVMDTPVDLDYAKINSDTPDLVVFMHDMENQAKQAAFAPIEMKNGQSQIKENSIYEQLFKLHTSKTATRAQKSAAVTTMGLIDGRLGLANPLNQMLAAHTDAVLTQNMGSAWGNIISGAALPDIPIMTRFKAMSAIHNDPLTQKLLREARITDTIGYNRELFDPKNIRYEDAGKDLYRISEKQVRAMTYVGKAMDVAEKRGVPWKEVVDGKTARAMSIRGEALREVRETQGSASKFSIRGGRVFAPGSFYLKNAALSEWGRTAAQAKYAVQTGDVRPIATNVGIRLALGGGRMVMDPDTAKMMIGIVNSSPLYTPAQKSEATNNLTHVVNGTETVDLSMLGFKDPVKYPLQAFDEQFGTNLSGRVTLGDLKRVPGTGMLSGRAEPIDLSASADDYMTATNPEEVSDARQDATMRLGATLSSFLPQNKGAIGSTFSVGPVRMSMPMVFNAIQSGINLTRLQQGGSLSYKDKPVPISPVAEVMAPVFGGHGNSGKIDRYRAAAQAGDLANVKQAMNRDFDNGDITPGTTKLMRQYLDTHGDYIYPNVPPDMRMLHLVKDYMEHRPDATERAANRQAQFVLQGAYSNSPDTGKRLQKLNQQVNEANTHDSVRAKKLNTAGVLWTQVKGGL